MRFWILLGLLPLALTETVQAASQDWTASSTTAMAITGDISLADDRVVFQNGTSLELHALGHDRPGLYRVTPEQNPELLNGNRLCGKQPPTFIVLAHSEDSASLAESQSLHLKVFNGAEAPPAAAAVGMETSAPGFRALFNYERAGAR